MEKFKKKKKKNHCVYVNGLSKTKHASIKSQGIPALLMFHLLLVTAYTSQSCNGCKVYTRNSRHEPPIVTLCCYMFCLKCNTGFDVECFFFFAKIF